MVAGLQYAHVFFQTVNLYFVKDDLKAVTGTIFILLTDIGASLKIYCLMKNMKILKQLMITLNCDLFQPKNLHQRKLIQPNLNSWTMFFWVFWILALGCLFFWSLFPILDRTVKDYRLPFLAWYPFDYRKTPTYQMAYVHQILGITFTAISNDNIDNLIAALNMYIGAQFDILCDNLKNIFDKDAPADTDKKLKGCVHHHKEILKFAEEANTFYNWLLFVQFFVGGISLGLAMFQLTVVSLVIFGLFLILTFNVFEVVPFSSEFYSFVIYGNAVLVEVFMYCWFGNEIEVKSSKVPYAVFESDWTGLSPNIKKNLVIFVSRVRRPLQISAFGLFFLSLETFVRILRTAWSYFALLRQVNSPQ
ncbi:7tm 6 domain containing protein [Asbolus verrucosus]|uniref:Odorant receptor n=1 Tax=Asbolus verrucosus TaxID=1661398 RepID=A0A482VHU3_ASBVE|nr:7tm 6 domain containing protein [Asbolus verrucosus]